MNNRFPIAFYCKTIYVQHVRMHVCAAIKGYISIFLGCLTFHCFNSRINNRVIKCRVGLLRMKWGHALKNMFAAAPTVPPLCWSFPTHRPVIGTQKMDSLSQKWGHDPCVDSFVDDDVCYWCRFQAASSQQPINSPELTLKSTQTTAVGKHFSDVTLLQAEYVRTNNQT